MSVQHANNREEKYALTTGIAVHFLHYRYRQLIHGPYGVVVGHNMVENRIFFKNVQRVEVFANGVVLVRAPAENIIAQIVFGNTNDATAMADLLISFRARQVVP